MKGKMFVDINIRKAILHNIKDNSLDQFEETIVDAIEDGEEKMLPGLGYLFELIWNEANNEERSDLLANLDKAVKKASATS